MKMHQLGAHKAKWPMHIPVVYKSSCLYHSSWALLGLPHLVIFFYVVKLILNKSVSSCLGSLLGDGYEAWVPGTPGVTCTHTCEYLYPQPMQVPQTHADPYFS
jgi:hypothetical protein